MGEKRLYRTHLSRTAPPPPPPPSIHASDVTCPLCPPRRPTAAPEPASQSMTTPSRSPLPKPPDASSWSFFSSAFFATRRSPHASVVTGALCPCNVPTHRSLRAVNPFGARFHSFNVLSYPALTAVRPLAPTATSDTEGRSIQSDVRVELKGVRSGVERHRGRGLKARGRRRDTPAKVLKDRRPPRQRDRMGTSV
eukprot:18923-Pelagococcus_subviridis.AAC.1